MTDEVKRKIKEQLLAVRDTGETNMLDSHTVQAIASRLGFYELMEFIEAYRRAYIGVICTGKFPWEVDQNA